jgi:hypothetical protein
VISVGTYAHAAAKHPIQARGITFNDNPQICIYKLEDEIESLLVEGEVIATQKHNPRSLEIWAEAHGIER